MHRLGTIRYRGLAEGRLHDLTLHGAFRTALGAISTDGSFRADSLFNHMEYDARVVGRRFRIGRLINHPQFSSLTIDIAAKGEINDGKGQGDVDAHVREMTYNGYTYNDLNIKGYIAPKRYQGLFSIHDPYMDVAFDGVVDLRDENPDIDFNLLCRHFDAAPLTDGNSSLQSSFALAVDLNGTSTDEMNGYLKLVSKELPEFSFRELNDVFQKQEGVPL